jgi:hypothetical protein
MSSDYDSTAPAAGGKPPRPVRPSKPYPDFPLFPHAAGYWAKTLRGKMHYFGPQTDLDDALAKYLEEKDALHAGGGEGRRPVKPDWRFWPSWLPLRGRPAPRWLRWRYRTVSARRG